MLTKETDEDRQELPGNSGQIAAVANMEKTKVVVSEKIEGSATDDTLPSYLDIDPARVKIKDPVRRLNNHEDTKSENLALTKSIQASFGSGSIVNPAEEFPARSPRRSHLTPDNKNYTRQNCFRLGNDEDDLQKLYEFQGVESPAGRSIGDLPSAAIAMRSSGRKSSLNDPRGTKTCGSLQWRPSSQAPEAESIENPAEELPEGKALDGLKVQLTSSDGLKQSVEFRHLFELVGPGPGTVKLVIAEKNEGRDYNDLSSYLNIEPASVIIKEPLRMPAKLSNHNDKDNDNDNDAWSRVRFGTYLGCDSTLKVFNSEDWTWNWANLLCEGRVLLQLHHPHVVQVMGFTQFMSKCIMVMELMDSDLRQFIKIRSRDGMRPFTWFEELDIITQIARGLLYLHEQDRYMKGEVKCSNILVKQIGDAILVKIIDLRSSQKRIYSQRAAQAAIPKLVIFNFFYKPWKGRELLKKADVYSFGMVCFEVLTGRLPFSNVGGDALERLVATGEMKPELPADMEPRLRALIKSCLARASHKRPTLDQICHRLGVIKSSQPGFFARVHRLLQMASLGVSQDMARASQLAASAESQDSAGASRSDCRPLILADCARIEPEKLKIERFLGRGASAEVHQATWLDCKVAVKTFNSSVSPAEVQAEVKFLTELRHHCVVRMLGLSVSKSGRRCSIVMEFMGSDLRKLIDSRMKINKTAPFEIHEAVYIITRIALGMLFLHTRGVAHRDLKSLNVLVPDHPASIEVKIADFGVSQPIGPNGDHTLRTVGTGFWRAPELLLAPPRGDDGEPLRSYDLKAADVYSFAMTSYEVVTGKVPLDDEEVTRLGLAAAKRKVIAGVLRPELPDGLNPVLKELIEECWAGKPEKRPTFSTICAKLRQIQRGELAGEPCFVPKKRSWTWWAKGELLGSGTFGTVYEGVGSDGTVFAVKLLPFSNLGRAGIQETRPLEQEIALLCRIQHPNIVEYLGTERDDEKLYIFQELVSNGSLADEYNRCKMFNDQIRSYTKQILSGLKYLHDRKIIHRDIKCANVLVGSSGVVKLADVGIMAKQTDKLALLKSSMAGSVHWMAPVVVNPNRRYRFKADIWSLGCTVLEMAIGGPPFGELEVHDVIWKVGHGEGPPLPDDLPDDIRSFISSCLEVDVALRPTCDLLMTHPFITGVPMTGPVKLPSTTELSSTADEGLYGTRAYREASRSQ